MLFEEILSRSHRKPALAVPENINLLKQCKVTDDLNSFALHLNRLGLSKIKRYLKNDGAAKLPHRFSGTFFPNKKPICFLLFAEPDGRGVVSSDNETSAMLLA